MHILYVHSEQQTTWSHTMNQVNRRQDQGDGLRRPTNVSLREALVSEARELGINVSRACEEGLENEIRRERARRWHEANALGFEAWNDYVERNGVPLARHRKF
jgi:antitoxin CcdA